MTKVGRELTGGAADHPAVVLGSNKAAVVVVKRGSASLNEEGSNDGSNTAAMLQRMQAPDSRP